MCEALKGRPRRCWGLQSKATNDRGLGFFTATSRLTGYYFINLAVSQLFLNIGQDTPVESPGWWDGERVLSWGLQMKAFSEE